MAEQQASEAVAAAPGATDWNSVRERYLAGEALEVIAQAHGIETRSISDKAYTEDWRAEALLGRSQADLSSEVRENYLLSVYRESRALRRMPVPRDAREADAWSRVRERSLAAAALLLGWERDPVAAAKPARCLEV